MRESRSNVAKSINSIATFFQVTVEIPFFRQSLLRLNIQRISCTLTETRHNLQSGLPFRPD